ncbi:MAG: MarR family winged helix-turn-helix transcriptional regulator [Acidimicrobiales bacterium]
MDLKSDLSPARSSVPAGRVAAWLARHVEMSLSECDLSLPQYRMLGLLGEGTNIPSSLADRLAVRRPSVTAVVDGLVARGLVRREHASSDRRHVTHIITEEGHRLLLEADRDIDAHLSEIVGALSDDDLSERALADLKLWGRALTSWHAAKHAG